MKKEELRDKFITGTFAIGDDGCKEPPDWKQYALKLEEYIKNTHTVDNALVEALTEDEIKEVLISIEQYIGKGELYNKAEQALSKERSEK